MATTARGIVYPTTSTVLTPLSNHFANLATSTNTALDTLETKGGAFRGLDSAKPAAGVEGRTWYSTDTNRLWFDDGSNWISNDGGMYLIRPTSIASAGGGSATQNARGGVDFTSVSSVSLNSVFTSRFRSYVVSYSIDSRTVLGGPGEDRLRLRVGGADASAGDYAWKRLVLSGTTVSNISNGSDVAFGGSIPSVLGSTNKSFRLDRPALAVPTWIASGGTLLDTDGATVDFGVGYAGVHKVSTAYDGISLLVSSGLMTGTISIYGLA